MEPLKVLPRKELTPRQELAAMFGLSDRQLTRWIRYCERRCLDWARLNRKLGKGLTPSFLHPYQRWVLENVLSRRKLGKDWLDPLLLDSDTLTITTWKTTMAGGENAKNN
jgi:hypothetical protein